MKPGRRPCNPEPPRVSWLITNEKPQLLAFQICRRSTMRLNCIGRTTPACRSLFPPGYPCRLVQLRHTKSPVAWIGPPDDLQISPTSWNALRLGDLTWFVCSVANRPSCDILTPRRPGARWRAAEAGGRRQTAEATNKKARPGVPRRPGLAIRTVNQPPDRDWPWRMLPPLWSQTRGSIKRNLLGVALLTQRPLGGWGGADTSSATT